MGQVLRQIKGNGGRDKERFGNGGRDKKRGFSERDMTEKKGDMERDKLTILPKV